MSKAAVRTMRIIALPLSSARGSKSKTILDTYYHFVTAPPHVSDSAKLSWPAWGIGKAQGIWTDFGKAKKGSWKLKTFQYGEKLQDRLDFEELALKNLDPSLGPKLTRPTTPDSKNEQPQIPLIYPTHILSSPLPNLHALLERRTPRHRRGFWFWLLISPLTAPFMIIPIIPNLPFFFCIWRSWHHYKAFRASEYLESLLKKGAIIPEGGSKLDQFYPEVDPMSEGNDKPELLLSQDSIPKLQEAFNLPSSFAGDLSRALMQAEVRLQAHELGHGDKK